MWNWIGLAAASLLAVGVILWIVLVVSLRTKYSPVLNAIRSMNRRFTNPRVMRTAGKPGASASVIHHTGRSTGKPYQTPIGVVDTGGGFVIALPYGSSTDWVKNVRTAGSAVITTEGQTYSVNDPQCVRAADINQCLSGKDRLTHWIYRVDQFLVLHRVDADVPAGDHR